MDLGSEPFKLFAQGVFTMKKLEYLKLDYVNLSSNDVGFSDLSKTASQAQVITRDV